MPRSHQDSDFTPSEPLEVLLESTAVTAYLDARIRDATRPWLELLRPEALAWLYGMLYVSLTMDPVLRGLVSQVARAGPSPRSSRARRRP